MVTCEHACCRSDRGFGLATLLGSSVHVCPDGSLRCAFFGLVAGRNLSDSGVRDFLDIQFLVPVGFCLVNNVRDSSPGSGFDFGLKVTRDLQQYPGNDHVRIVNIYTRRCWHLR